LEKKQPMGIESTTVQCLQRESKNKAKDIKQSKILESDYLRSADQ